jgi:fimbrial chaperone protein
VPGTPSTIRASRHEASSSAGLGVVTLALLVLGLGADGARAAQLRVEPILLEMTAPAAAGTLTLHNEQGTEVAVQTRVLRWTLKDGKESLEPTDDVVASPPIATLAPNAEYIVRVVRVSKVPVRSEESYRVIVDQLPDLRRQQTRTVNLLIRQSIPVFFRPQQLAPARLSWTFREEGGKLLVVATNSGDERVRIASLRLRDGAGRTVFFGNGLVGYVLGRSFVEWTAPGEPRGFGAAGPVTVSAETDKGPLNATARASGRP